MPWTAAAVAGSAVIGGVLQSQGQGAANRQAERNLELQKQMFDKQVELSTAPNRDIYGNQTTYVPGQGWRVQATPQVSNLINAGQAEQLKSLTTDSDLARTGKIANSFRRQQEGRAADSVLGDVTASPFGSSPDSMIAKSYLAKAHGIKQGYADARSDALRQAVRSPGASNAGDIIAKVAQREAGDLGAASDAAYGDGTQQWQNLTQAYQAGKGNLYNTLAARASNVNDAPFMPSSIPGETAATQGQRFGQSNALPYSAANVRGSGQSFADSIAALGKSQGQTAGGFGALGGNLYTALANRQPGNQTTGIGNGGALGMWGGGGMMPSDI